MSITFGAPQPWFTPESPAELAAKYTATPPPHAPLPITRLETLALAMATKQKAYHALEAEGASLHDKIRAAHDAVQVAQGHIDAELHAQKIAVFEKYGIVMDHFGSIRPPPKRSEELTDMLEDRNWTHDSLDGSPLLYNPPSRTQGGV